MPDHPSSPESPISTSPPDSVSAPIPTQPLAASRISHRRLAIFAISAIVIIGLLILAIPWLIQSFTTVSTDDAYVNGHVTFVAPRVAGQVARVLVEDNNRVHKGDLLVQLDKEPFQVQVNIAQAAVNAAQADVKTAQAQTRALEGQARSQRFALEHAVEDVDNQIALLHAKVATLESQKATLAKAQADYERAQPLVQSGGITKEELDRRREVMLVAQADVEQALQGVYQVRVSLGLPPKPLTSTTQSSTTLSTTQPTTQPGSDLPEDLTQVPPDLDQSFSSVRQAQYSLMQAAAQLGVFQPVNVTPKEMIAEFYKRDPSGNLEKIYDQILKDAPAIKQAESKLAEAQRNLDQANLNLSYCDIVSEIDGVITRRDVNPGNNVIVGQSLMAVRSLTEIWIDANFKETQLRDLKIGQRVDIDADMYGRRKRFSGRITGFTMGTGSTLALLPAENATGNFVKVVQRLPVRIELTDYDPDKDPLFIGLSVTPIVHVNEEPSGPDAGKKLQPYMAMEKASRTMPATQP